MGATIAGSLIAGDDVRWQEVAAAGVGGFAGGVAFSLSGNIIAASAAETVVSTSTEAGLNKLSGVEKPASKYAKQGALTGKMAKRNYIDEAIAFPFVTGGNIANKLLSK
jgi:hypothetical protein